MENGGSACRKPPIVLLASSSRRSFGSSAVPFEADSIQLAETMPLRIPIRDATDAERRKKRDAAIRTQDELIAEHLDQAYKSGELQSALGFGKPLPEAAGYLETRVEFRMPFKILRNAGIAPPEV